MLRLWVALFCIAFHGLPVAAQTSVGLMSVPGMQSFDTNEEPPSEGKVFTHHARTNGFAMPGHVQYPDRLPGADMCAKLATAHTNLPTAGGIIDMRKLSGAPATCAAGVTFTKPVTLIWGVMNITCPASADSVCMTFNGRGNKIIGTKGQSKITQGSLGTNLIVVNGGQTEIRNMSFVGVSGAGISLSLDNAIKCVNCRRINVHNNDFTGLRGYALYVQQGSDISFNGNTVHGTTNGVLFRGSNRVHVNRNTFSDPQTGTSIFVTAIQNDSTNSGFGVTTNFEFISNHFSNWTDAQAILVHSGRRGKIIGNICHNSLQCVNMNAFQAGDVLDHIIVAGNTSTHPISGANQSGGADPNYAIEGLPSQIATNISFVRNRGRNGNFETAADNQGCVSIQWTDGLVMSGNKMKSCKGSCYTFNNGNNIRMAVRNNSCLDLVGSSGGVKVGFYVTSGTGSTGRWYGNTVDNGTSCYRSDAATAVLLEANVKACTNTTETVHNPENFKMETAIKR